MYTADLAYSRHVHTCIYICISLPCLLYFLSHIEAVDQSHCGCVAVRIQYTCTCMFFSMYVISMYACTCMFCCLFFLMYALSVSLLVVCYAHDFPCISTHM